MERRWNYYHLHKAKENVSEIQKIKRIPRIVYTSNMSSTDVYRKKKGDVLLAMKISAYINFIRNTSKAVLNNSSCKIWRVYCQRQRLICR